MLKIQNTSGKPSLGPLVERPPGALKSYPNNPRKRSAKQLTPLKASIKRYGFTNPVIVDENDVILSGHGRVTAALELGMVTVPTRRITGLSEAEKRGYVIGDNKIAALSSWDATLLKSEVELLIQDDFEIETTGFSTAEIDVMFDDLAPPPQTSYALKITFRTPSRSWVTCTSLVVTACYAATRSMQHPLRQSCRAMSRK